VEESDWDLVVAAKNGNDRAFEILIKRYEARMLSLASRITRNREDAQDVVQQTFQNALVHLQKFQGESAFSTWLTRIAINEALMCLRKNRVSRTVSLEGWNRERNSVFTREIPDASANPEETCIRMEKERILSFVIDGLPPILQRAVRLYLDDLTVEEMGQCLGVRTSTVKARLLRGRQKASALFKRYVTSTARGAGTKLQNAA
jgi:RNA polymerase sigma-70 factor (ECF subfamily)